MVDGQQRERGRKEDKGDKERGGGGGEDRKDKKRNGEKGRIAYKSRFESTPGSKKNIHDVSENHLQAA